VKDQLYKGSRSKKELDIEKVYEGKLLVSFTEFGSMIIRPDNTMTYKFYFDKARNKKLPQIFTIEVNFDTFGDLKFLVQGAKSFLPVGIIEEPYEKFFITQVQASTVEYEILEQIHEVEE